MPNSRYASILSNVCCLGVHMAHNTKTTRTHVVYGVKNLVTHVPLLLCLYVSIILPKRNPVNHTGIVVRRPGIEPGLIA